jgi:hypothetical protein
MARKGVEIKGERCKGKNSTTYVVGLASQSFLLNNKDNVPLYEKRIIVSLNSVRKMGKRNNRYNVSYFDRYTGTIIHGTAVLSQKFASRKRTKIPLRKLQA